jgi:hypothetical protein
MGEYRQVEQEDIAIYKVQVDHAQDLSQAAHSPIQ